MEELRILVAEALSLPITDIVIQSSIIGWIALGAAVVSASASIYGQVQANKRAQDNADAQEAITKARAAANRQTAKFQYEQAQDAADIAKADAKFALAQSEDAFALGMGQNAEGYREATKKLGLQENQMLQQFEQSMQQIENARQNTIKDIQTQKRDAEAQLAAVGGRSGSTRDRMQSVMSRATGSAAFATEQNLENVEYQKNVSEKQLDWAESAALRKKRTGVVQLSEQMEQTEEQYQKLMGGGEYGEGTIAERLQSAKEQRDSVVGAGNYAASAMNVEDYSGGFGTADLMTSSAALQKKSVYDQTGGWSIFSAGMQGASQGFGITSNVAQFGANTNLWSFE